MAEPKDPRRAQDTESTVDWVPMVKLKKAIGLAHILYQKAKALEAELETARSDLGDLAAARERVAEPKDPAELWVVLTPSGNPEEVSAKPGATDRDIRRGHHVTRYVLASELDRIHAAIGGRASHGPKGDADCAIEWIAEAKERIAELEAQVAAERVELSGTLESMRALAIQYGARATERAADRALVALEVRR